MARVFVLAKRMLLLTVIWGLAGAAIYHGIREYSEYRRLTRSVSTMRAQYDTKLSDYAQLLHRGQQLESDDEYKVELLKKRFGYTRPDETPVVILNGQN